MRMAICAEKCEAALTVWWSAHCVMALAKRWPPRWHDQTTTATAWASRRRELPAATMALPAFPAPNKYCTVFETHKVAFVVGFQDFQDFQNGY